RWRSSDDGYVSLSRRPLLESNSGDYFIQMARNGVCINFVLRVTLLLVIAAPMGIVPARRAQAQLRPLQPAAPAIPVTELVLDSDPGDYIGAGQHLTYTSNTSSFTPNVSGTDGTGAPTYITIFVS